MNPSQVLLVAFLIGVSPDWYYDAPAALLGPQTDTGHLYSSPLAFMGSTAAVAVFTALALAELIIDKHPSTPNRTHFSAHCRSVLGGLSGAAVVASGRSDDTGRCSWRGWGDSGRLCGLRGRNASCALSGSGLSSSLLCEDE